MAYRVSGVATFQFADVVVEGLDPVEARREVEHMTIDELLGYASDVEQVEVTHLEVVLKRRGGVQ